MGGGFMAAGQGMGPPSYPHMAPPPHHHHSSSSSSSRCVAVVNLGGMEWGGAASPYDVGQDQPGLV